MNDDGLDLSPREPEPTRRRRRRWGPIIALVVVIAAGALVVVQFLGNALDYYCNADEVGVKSECSGDRNLRVQGMVARGSVVEAGAETRFVIAFNGKSVPVVYDGVNPKGKFQECIPVVVRGHMENGVLQGNEVAVKHSNEYAENDARLEDASAAECPQAA